MKHAGDWFAGGVTWKIAGWLVVAGGAAACFPPEPMLEELSGTAGTIGASGTVVTAGQDTTATTNPVVDTSQTATDTDPTDPTDPSDSESTETTGSPFPGCEDYEGNPSQECDLWLQDCPPGEKCMPWAADGGSSWNASRCSPIDPDPRGVDESCMVEGSGVSGIDDCDFGSMCWDVDPETNQGICTPLCVGCPDVMSCDPGRACQTANGGFIIVCIPRCDPLLQDCGPDEACYPVDDDFVCAPDASGRMGIPGDPCEFINVCDPGLACIETMLLADCMGSFGCCSPFCDLTDPMADGQCPGVASGEVCDPWYEVGMAPPGYEDVGICRLP